MTGSYFTGAIYCLIATLIYITIIFFIAQSKKRYDIVDIAWGGGFIVVALTSMVIGSANGVNGVKAAVTGLVLIWGLRLAYTILRRVLRTPDEDKRYAEMRGKWQGNVALNAYFRIFFTQGILAFIIAFPVMHANFMSTETSLLFLLPGLLIWLIGFYFEAVGDMQLKNFLAKPEHKGQLMQAGLWRYTRHPNYFGEVTQWWGIFIITLSVPYGWATVFAPLLITYLILKVSGVPLTEKHFASKPGWEEYKLRTSVFIPLPPKSV